MQEMIQHSSARRSIRRCAVPVAVAVLGATAWIAVPSAHADSSPAGSKSFTSTSKGEGHARGLDFTAAGSASWAGIGDFTFELANDPNATVLAPPANGEILMDNFSSGTYSASNGDKVFTVGKGHYVFKYLTLPNGATVPDFSKDVKLSVAGTVIGGTGRYANATGSYTEEGIIKTAGPPPSSPDAEVVTAFTTTGKGTVTPNSGGGRYPSRFELSDTERDALVRSAKELPRTSARMSLAPGVYSAELRNWRVTFRVSQGWDLNGYQGLSVGTSTGVFTSPAYAGLVFLDDPVVFDDPAVSLRLQRLTIPARDWLSVATGVTVDESEPISAGAKGSSFTLRMSSANPIYRMAFLESWGTFVPAIPSWSVHMAEFRSPDGHKLVVGTAGVADPRRQLDTQLIAVERR